MNLRVIDTGANNGFYNMAVDEALLLGCKKQPQKFPTLRFYTFSPSAITIGRFQSFENIRKEQACLFSTIDIVRRITGGRAVFHNGDITYSLVASTDNTFFGSNVFEGYKKVSLIFRDALQFLGIKAELVKVKSSEYQKNIGCFSSLSRYELQINNNKILGSAQRVKDEVILQQGSLMLNAKCEMQNTKWEQVGLSQIVGREIKREEIISAVKESINNMEIKAEQGILTSEEKDLANKLVPKYQKEMIDR